MKMHYKQLSILLLCLLLCVAIAAGCGKQPPAGEQSQAPPKTSPADSQSQQPDSPPRDPAQAAGQGKTQPIVLEKPKPPADDDFRPPMPPQTPPGEPAKPGVGQLGAEIADGPLGTPVKALFRAQETLAFMRLKQPMELYRAIHGHYPKTHEEFFEEIVKKNNIRLPPLPEGTRYLYDAQMAAEMSSYNIDDPPLRVVRE